MKKINLKKVFAMCVVAAGMLAMQSCCIVNVPVCSNDDGKIGSKVGEATSTQILGLFSKGGKQQTLKEAAKNGNITKITQVEYTQQLILGGILVNTTTRVYGE